MSKMGTRQRSRTVFAAGSLLSLLLVALPPVALAGETRRIEGIDFEDVLVLGSIDVEVRQGSPAELQIQGDADHLEPLPFSMSGDTLIIGRHSRANNKSADKLRYRVVLPVLEKLRLKGSGAVYVKPFIDDGMSSADRVVVSLEGSGGIMLYGVEHSDVELSVKGPGKIKAQNLDTQVLEALVAGSGDLFIGTLSAEDAEFTITGSGDVVVTEPSFAESAEVNVIGSGDARLKNLRCDRAELNVIGSGDIAVGEVAKQLNSSILGSGDIRYDGNAEVEKVELGSGEVRRRD
ncbi:MAG: hypothetical protein Cons2KO_24700 [Congregibacter sp.]